MLVLRLGAEGLLQPGRLGRELLADRMLADSAVLYAEGALVLTQPGGALEDSARVWHAVNKQCLVLAKFDEVLLTEMMAGAVCRPVAPTVRLAVAGCSRSIATIVSSTRASAFASLISGS